MPKVQLWNIRSKLNHNFDECGMTFKFHIRGPQAENCHLLANFLPDTLASSKAPN